MRWIPFLGWEALDADAVEACELDPYVRWEGLHLEWLGAGVILCVRPVEMFA